ncbi:glycoside hydrolase family 3 [Pedobacter yulinensis]|uniref:beta-N-acetylhexosaminidase n=1 Tax=Pedobacter yulinensis TaxID=2126353 RepID=A0A2T3HRF7_9SPHI|nr:glycoside hydrolase family 3 N-terminal domain-containing protein [Pedobacter yulinensis]PST84981.1 glycoside hydrolase family 3 [Pedobacter yulinensis]
MTIKKPVFLFALAVLASGKLAAQQPSFSALLDAPPRWVDSVFNKMSRHDRIAQLLFVRAHTNLSQAYQDSVGRVIKNEHLGGVVFFQGGPVRQAALTNKYQSVSRYPLLVTSDGEWGLGMRLDSTMSYPYQMALGAIQDKSLLHKMGLEVAKDFKRIGMHMNLAPVVDVNNNARNPVINYRSFGENKYNVAQKAGEYVRGMQDGGLITSIKHFPGHGDTDVDSHYDLPQLKFSKERLDTLEMYPFRELIRQGVSGVMVAHMNIPSLDNTPNLPSTLSKPIITDVLKKEMNFKGIVISDAMDMKGVVKYFKDGEAEVRGILAGNDILELSENSVQAVKMIRRAVRKGRISMDQIDSSVKKILTAKYFAGLHQADTVNLSNLSADLNRSESVALRQQLADASMTLLRGQQYVKTLSPLRRTVLISIGMPEVCVFQKELAAYYKNSVHYVLSSTANANAIAKILRETSGFDQMIIGIHDSRTRPGNNMPLSADVRNFIREMAGKRAAFAFFANPYNLAAIPGLENSSALLVAYQKEEWMQKAAAAVFKNELIATGRLPVTVNSFFKYGDRDEKVAAAPAD